VGKKLNAYRGKLTAEKLTLGMNAATRNARRLAEDAELLLNAGRFPSAASLAILSIEEVGKVSILRALAVARTETEAAEEWKNYRSHTRKNVLWITPQLISKGARKFDDFRSIFDERSDHPFVLDQLKQLGFYTDCIDNSRWAIPIEVIDESLARSLVATAKMQAGTKEVTCREIELWIEHVGPVWKKEYSWMKQAVIKWYAAMQSEGLAPEGANEVADFVRNEKPNA
jgi:AbiV family abortive infection protein